MDDQRFDAWIKAFASEATRRNALKLIGAAFASAVTSARGLGRVSAQVPSCKKAGDCPDTSDPCKARTCIKPPGAGKEDAGTCGFEAANEGKACSDGNACTVNDTCRSGTCVPGTPKTCPTSSDPARSTSVTPSPAIASCGTPRTSRPATPATSARRTSARMGYAARGRRASSAPRATPVKSRPATRARAPAIRPTPQTIRRARTAMCVPSEIRAKRVSVDRGHLRPATSASGAPTSGAWPPACRTRRKTVLAATMVTPAP